MGDFFLNTAVLTSLGREKGHRKDGQVDFASGLRASSNMGWNMHQSVILYYKEQIPCGCIVQRRVNRGRVDASGENDDHDLLFDDDAVLT